MQILRSLFHPTNFLGAAERPMLRKLIFVYVSVASVYIVARYLREVSRGGQVWTTGDWLISYRAGFIRRGLTGSITYGLTDLTGIDALHVAAATQILVYAALLASVLYMLSRLKMTVPVALLAISPAFLLMAFFFPKLGMSKEMIGFLAVALVGLTAFTRRNGSFFLGIAIFTASGFAHEINAFLAPDLLALLLILAGMKIIPKRQAWLAALIVVLAAGSAILTAMLYSGVGKGAALCQVILSYGGWEEFCGKSGPTVWLDRDMAYGMQFTWDANVQSGIWPWFVVGWVLSMLPFFLFRVTDDPKGQGTRRVLFAACAGILAYAPLFVIASDWGRWIAMHVFCMTILTFVSLRLGLLGERNKDLSPVFLVFALVWAMPDYGQPLTAGFLKKVGTAVTQIESFFRH